jgi:acyl dehydratase
MTMSLLVGRWISPESSLGSAGLSELRWPKPVRPGDTLLVRATVLEARRSASKPDRGIVTSQTEVTDSRGDLVMRMTSTNFVLLRDPTAPQ